MRREQNGWKGGFTPWENEVEPEKLTSTWTNLSRVLNSQQRTTLKLGGNVPSDGPTPTSSRSDALHLLWSWLHESQILKIPEQMSNL